MGTAMENTLNSARQLSPGETIDIMNSNKANSPQRQMKEDNADFSTSFGTLEIPEGRSSEINTPTTVPEEVANDGVNATFPQQLMNIIEQETKDGTDIDGERVLEWLPNGDAFIIRDKKALERKVLPRYFSSRCKFTSFVRKLYRYVCSIDE